MSAPSHVFQYSKSAGKASDKGPQSPPALVMGPLLNGVETLAQRSGLSEEELTKQLSQVLPGIVDKLTPAGRLPSLAELPRS
jgi:hypothetical protein